MMVMYLWIEKYKCNQKSTQPERTIDALSFIFCGSSHMRRRAHSSVHRSDRSSNLPRYNKNQSDFPTNYLGK